MNYRLFTLVWLVSLNSLSCAGLFTDRLYSYGSAAGDQKLLPKDEGSTNEIELQIPFVFYGETYFSLFININGLISFLTEIPYFFNAQFPLDYPVIAPFYSDVDTSKAGTIWYRETSDPKTVTRAVSDLRSSFESASQFEPQSVFITTYEGVGSFQSRRDKVNTFQVVMVTDGRDSYVIFNYADGGLQWLQGDGKTSGLPDALGQAGFVSGDGRLYTIRGSGTDQVRNLDKWSNVGEPGVWRFRVGRTAPGRNIQAPNLVSGIPSGDKLDAQVEVSGSSDCASGGGACHSSGSCVDYDDGFCCKCNEEYYGNGINCLKKDNPIRVTGSVTGNINGIDISDGDFHSYVLSSEGRTYTAVSRIPKEVGYDLQSLTSTAEAIAWLFALPKKGVPNGFTQTGGAFNRTVEVTFPQTGHKATVEQVFEGLDVFNNVAVTTTVMGSLPSVPFGSELVVDAFKEEFTKVRPGQLRARSNRSFRLKGQTLDTPYLVETFIRYEECEHAPKDPQLDTLRLKVAENIFIRYDEAEAIVRYSFSAKVGTLEEEDPCVKGRQECGPNSQCIVDGDSFRCVCEQGYDYVFDTTTNAPVCLDMNECNIGRNLCDVNAVCINVPGSYTCRCKSGFTGDGHYCKIEFTCHNAGCDPNASCEEISGQPECTCKVGYKGDGFFCTPDFGDDSCHIAQNCSPYAVCAPSANGGYACRCLPGYVGDGYTCEMDRLGLPDSYKPYYPPTHSPQIPDDGIYQPYYPPLPVPEFPEVTPQPTLRPYDPYVDSLHISGTQESVKPECLLDVCWCPPNYLHNRQTGMCDKDSGQQRHDNGNPRPVCGAVKCRCPEGYVYNVLFNQCDTALEAPACNIVNNCHPNAQCLYFGDTGQHRCTCNAGFTGDGLFCSPLEVSCDQVDVCHLNAECIYDDTQLRSVCVCKAGYIGDGLVCSPQDDCSRTEDCDSNAQCIFDGLDQRYVCRCNAGYQGDGFVCNPIDDSSCNILNNCDANARCVYDSYSGMHRCQCLEGFEGDGYLCRKIEVGCNVLRNCGPNAECVYDETAKGHKCQCRQGFKGDGFFCQAIRNCLNDPGMCHPQATCERSSFDDFVAACVCRSGYTGDGFSCEEAPDHEKNILLLNQGLSVLRMPVNKDFGNGSPIHIDPYMTAVGADIDCMAGRYYWTDVGSRSVRSTKYDGSERKPIISGGQIGSPEDVAVDWVSQNIYWTDSLNDIVAVAKSDGSKIRTVIEGDLVNPRGIAVHPGAGLLFWSDWNRNNPKIEVSGMDGSDRKFLASGAEVSLPNSLVVDYETSSLCWADAGTHRIECIGIQGYGRRVVIQGIKYPFGLTVHERSFFYTDWEDTRIHEVGKYTGTEEGSRSPPPGGSGKLYGIVAVPAQCPSITNACQVSNGGCPEAFLCLPNGKGGRTCACSDEAKNAPEKCTDYLY